eukprot:jgi/Mesen1/7833/ME000417S07132
MATSYVRLLVWCAMLVVSCQGELLQVLIVHRHGSRTRLGKNDSTLLESASRLTSAGEMQLYKAGTQFRARYLAKLTCAVTNTCLKGGSADWDVYSNSNMYIQSSGIERTLMSAYAFLLGVLPPLSPGIASNFSSLLGKVGGIQAVPIFSGPPDTDYIIRGFGEAKCKTLLDRLSAFYKSEYFLAKVSETAALRQTLSDALQQNITLQDIWNTFDAYNVQYAYGPGTPAGGPPLPPISNSTWQQLMEAAAWMEWNRYGNSSQAGSLCGGAMLADMQRRIDSSAAALLAIPPSISPGPRYVHYSGHYATQLCLLAAININPTAGSSTAEDPNAWLHKIPKYGAVMVLEVHSDSTAPSGLRIRLVLQDGQDAPFRTVVLPCATNGTDGSCTYDDFKTVTSDRVVYSVGDFCDACANTTMTQCAAAKYMALLAANNGSIGNLTSNLHPKGASFASSTPAWDWHAILLAVHFVVLILLLN